MAVTVKQDGGGEKRIAGVMETGDHFGGSRCSRTDRHHPHPHPERTPRPLPVAIGSLSLLDRDPELRAAFQQIAVERLAFGPLPCTSISR